MGDSNYQPLPTRTGDISRRQRITFAAISGFAAGTICALVSSFINVWLYPDLPVYVAWLQVFGSWLILAGAAAVFAGVAANQPDGWVGVVQAAFGMAVTALVVALAPAITLNTLVFYLVIMFALSIPITAIFSPVAFLFLWLARRFVEVREAGVQRGWKVLTVNIIFIIMLGFLPGLYSKFSKRAEQAVRMTHALFQEAAQAGSAGEYPSQLAVTDGFTEHRDQAYAFSQVDSVSSAVGVDVTAHYADGYAISCTVVLYPGSDPYINQCRGKQP
jgi:MFS family permease